MGIDTACRTPLPPRRPTETRLWTLDLCPYVAFVPNIRRFATPGGAGFERGFFEFVSAHPIRGAYITTPRNDEEVCRYHYCRPGTVEEGATAAIYCSRPAGDRTDYHIARPYIQRLEHPTTTGVEQGFCGMLGRYHAPYWTEAHLNGSYFCCGGVS